LNGISNWGVGDWATFNGTAWQRVEGGAAGNFTDLTASGSVTLSGGTANGVAYLNGSKVLTTGSALTFDGTNLGIGTSSPTSRLVVQQAQNTGDGIRLLASGSDTTLLTRYLSSIDAWQITSSYGTTGAYKPIAWFTSDLERMRLDSSGNLGIGTSSPAAKLDLSANAVIMGYFRSSGGSANDQRLTITSGGGRVVLDAATNSTGASSAFGFTLGGTEGARLTTTGLGIFNSSPSNPLSVTGNANFSGIVGIGGATTASVGAYVTNNALSGTTQFGVASALTGTSAATVYVAAFGSVPATANAAFTAADVMGFRASNATKGAASTITNLHGVYIADQTQGTNNYGITSLVSSGTNKWNIYASGTAANYFAGNVGIGTTTVGSPLTVVGAAGYVVTIDGATDTRLDFKNSGTRNGIIQSTSTAFSVNAVTSIPLLFLTGSAERMRLDASGNLGLGVTPSAWTSTYKAIDVTSRTSFVGTTGGLSIFSNNSYFDGTNWIYRVTDAASRYQQDTSAHKWFIAASGTAGNAITFTQAMTLDASGNLGIGTSSPSASAILDAQSTTKGVRMPNMTTTQKNAIASPAAGLMVYDTTLAKLCVYTTAWETITSL
jgi:hypothetical protein